MNSTSARVWFGATAAAAAIGIGIQAVLVAGNSSGHFGTPAARVFNLFCFFTVESNVIVCVTTLLLAMRLERSSAIFAVFRLVGVVAITITGIVYHVALAHLLELEGWNLVADQLLHTAVPIMAVAGWLLFGPRGLTSRTVVWLSLLFPALYMIFTTIRGEIVKWYPYPFANVSRLGYGKVSLNAFWIMLLCLGVAAGAAALDGFLTRQTR
jgi:hypothetical protein